ncbi:Gti1/Pac2 family-domain-containing protein [Infundibulicybe gibba]|nr:Gti1/Pac2 family-domain-containing protein [Infundibulicybe gibba]
MQQPTLRNVRIRSTRDALHVFNGVAMNLLPLITRRLDAEERRAIVPGNVYVWEERGANTEPTGLGMERWTDGMGWGPSRVRDDFLFYHQKESDPNDEAMNPVTPWVQMMRKRDGVSTRLPYRLYPSTQLHQMPEAERLIKQTYSVHVYLPADRPKNIIRKWHLTAYFSQQTLDGLLTIDAIQGIGDVDVPDAWFKSARAGKSRRDTRSIPGSNPLPSERGNDHTSLDNPIYSRCSTPRQNEIVSHLHPSNSPLPHHTPPPPSVPSVGQLVPLEYLQSISYPKRDPADEQLLRRFSSKTSIPAGRRSSN